jgi:hypothetical protein
MELTIQIGCFEIPPNKLEPAPSLPPPSLFGLADAGLEAGAEPGLEFAFDPPLLELFWLLPELPLIVNPTGRSFSEYSKLEM